MAYWWAPLAVNAATSYLGGSKAKKESKRQAELKGAAIIETSEEQIRRRTLEQGQELSQGISFMGAANIQHVGDTGYDKVLKDMQMEFGKEISWMRRAAEFEMLGVNSELRSAKNTIDFQGLQNITSGLLMSGQAAGWWK